MSIAGNMPALLLVGPTGSGKSPLGALLEQRTGWAHFDFGHELRAIARGAVDYGLTEDEVQYVSDLLSNHALFPDDRFPIVKKILAGFLKENRHAQGLILNGLPRHIGQAVRINEMVEVRKVAVLNCAETDSRERVAMRAAGIGADHAARPDDTGEAVSGKIQTYAKETVPLVEHYRSIGSSVIDMIVDSRTTESNLASQILEWF